MIFFFYFNSLVKLVFLLFIVLELKNNFSQFLRHDIRERLSSYSATGYYYTRREREIEIFVEQLTK